MSLPSLNTNNILYPVLGPEDTMINKILFLSQKCSKSTVRNKLKIR